MKRNGYSDEEIETLKAQCQGILCHNDVASVLSFFSCLWLCVTGLMSEECLPKQGIWNGDDVLNHVKHQLNVCNQFMANHQLEETCERIGNLGRMLRLIPEIQTWAESSRDVEIRGVFNYGEVLRPRLWGEFRTIPEYMQMLKNWRVFLEKHLDCEALFILGYKNFLDDACAFMKERVQDDAYCAEIAELKDAVEKGWRVLPFRVRVRKWVYGLFLRK